MSSRLYSARSCICCTVRPAAENKNSGAELIRDEMEHTASICLSSSVRSLIASIGTPEAQATSLSISFSRLVSWEKYPTRLLQTTAQYSAA